MKMTICRDNRTFEAYVGSLGSGLTEVSFYEVVRPTWKIFRTKFFPLGSKGFFVDNYIGSLGSGLAEVSFYEVVCPIWKIFRTKFFPLGSKGFFVDNYADISFAVQDCLSKCLAKEAHEKELAEKWKNFEKAIDKPHRV